MRLVKFIIAVSLAATFSVGATQYKLQDDAPVYYDARDTLIQYMNKSGKCEELFRIGDSVSQFPHEVGVVMREAHSDKMKLYVPYMTYSCMISGDPTYAGYIPEEYVKKMPR